MTTRGSLLLLAGLAVVASPALSRPSSGDDLRGAEIRVSRAAGAITVDGDLDVRWTPSASVALAYPERRPFFLEGVDLFSTPIPAVHTRAVTSPRGGLRGTPRG